MSGTSWLSSRYVSERKSNETVVDDEWASFWKVDSVLGVLLSSLWGHEACEGCAEMGVGAACHRCAPRFGGNVVLNISAVRFRTGRCERIIERIMIWQVWPNRFPLPFWLKSLWPIDFGSRSVSVFDRDTQAIPRHCYRRLNHHTVLACSQR